MNVNIMLDQITCKNYNFFAISVYFYLKFEFTKSIMSTDLPVCIWNYKM